MLKTRRLRTAVTVAFAVFVAIFARCAAAQSNPYELVHDWAPQLPAGRPLGNVTGVDVDKAGHIWALERCGADTCVGSNFDPILEFDASSGKLLKSFGAGMFVLPHGFYLDNEGNIWTTDGGGDDGSGKVVQSRTADGSVFTASGGAKGKGQTVMKFSPEGKLLLTLGTPGVAGESPSTFNAPSDVVVAPNGDIFVADGHGGDTNARVVKFNKEGKFILAWGKKGSAPGEFNIPHSIDIDSTGRLFVGDRDNNRIQIFNQQGEFLGEWKQFGKPSGIAIDSDDMMYVADSQSTLKNNPGIEQAIRIGSTKDGVVKYLIPPTVLPPGSFFNLPLAPGEKPITRPAALAVDAVGNIYEAESGTRNLRKYRKMR